VLYPAFGHVGSSYFLGASEWTFGSLLLAGFWDKRDLMRFDEMIGMPALRAKPMERMTRKFPRYRSIGRAPSAGLAWIRRSDDITV
jgi:hypothetical protein